MHTVQEVATLTSKGQITLPKPIRQALGLEVGGKLAFNLRGKQVMVSRLDDAPHVDPAIAGFLTLLEKDIATGRNLSGLPAPLSRAMRAALKRRADLREDIQGDVAL